jgi:hypothetical protein
LLIRLGLVPPGLQVQDFLDTILPENVMASANALAKAQPQQEPSQVRERDIGVGGPPVNLLKYFVASGQVGPP